MSLLEETFPEVALPSPIADDQDVAWRKQAECVGHPTELFFSEHPTVMAEAKAICERCPVRSECVTEGLALGHRYDQGIRGGLSANIRNRVLRRGTLPSHYRNSGRVSAKWDAGRNEYEVSVSER